jgi:hypothetical protein
MAPVAPTPLKIQPRRFIPHSLVWSRVLHAIDPRRALDGGPHALVGTAAADVGHGLVDVGVGRLGLFLQQRGGSHQHAALAIAALGHLLRNPGQLQRMRPGGGTQRLNGLDTFARQCGHGRDAGAHWLAVHPHGARPTGGNAAAKFGACHIEHVAQYPQQGHGRGRRPPAPVCR